MSRRNNAYLPEVILESIYPHKQYADPNAVMRNQMYLLRKALRPQGDILPLAENLVYTKGRYRWEDNVWSSIESDCFEALIARGRSASLKEPQEAISLYREALALYKDHYLADLTDSEWVIPLRIHYQDLYFSAVFGLINLLKENNDHEEICTVCDKALSVDYFDERIHVCFIKALLARGLKARARAHYNRATATFYSEMGIKPSRAMKNLYRSISYEAAEFDPSWLFDHPDHKPDHNQVASIVDAAVFQHILKFELARKKSSENVYSCRFSLVRGDFGPPAPEELPEAMDQLQGIIINFLDSGSLITRWNEAQFIVLLPGIDREEANQLVLQIEDSFRSSLPQSSYLLQQKVVEINPPAALYSR